MTCALPVLAPGRFDHVRIDRTLRQPFHILELRGLLVEHFDEHASDDLAFGLGIRLAAQLAAGSVASASRG